MWEGLLMLLVLSVVMALASFLAGSLPLSFSLSPRQLRLITAVGTGVLVGTALIVIIPEGVETIYSARQVGHSHSERALSLDKRSAAEFPRLATHAFQLRDTSFSNVIARAEPQLTGPDDGRPDEELPPPAGAKKDKPAGDEEWEPHAWVGISLILGFVMMYLIDQLPRHVSASSKPQRFYISLDRFNLQRSSNNVPEAEDPDNFPPPDPMHQSRPSSTTVGLVIHAAADGIALGASSTSSSRKLGFIVFLALMIHKAPAAFGLTSALLKQGLSKRRARTHLIIFSLAAPIGALLTWAVANIFEGGNLGESGAQFFTGVLLLFSGGTFMYVAMHTMQDNTHNHGGNEPAQNGYGDPQVYDGYQSSSTKQEGPVLSDTLAVVGGMLLPLLTQFGHVH